MTFRNRMKQIPRWFWPTLTMFLALAIVFGVYVHSEKQIDRANEQRHLSFLLADQLRQSSDDLTRMARTYVVTGDPIYKQHYQDILDIRNGSKPRPDGYFRVYWDLVLADAPLRGDGGQAVALMELMRQAGFAEEELSKLAAAKANSDRLTAVEFEAMKLAESVGPDAEAKRTMARLMMHDASYHRNKAAIMQPINEVYALMGKRTADRVYEAERKAIMLRIVFVACALGALFMLWQAYAALRKTLGGSASEVHKQMQRIGESDLSRVIEVAPGMEGSVLAGLSAMQERLKTIEAEREAADRVLRLSEQRFSTAFSSCPVAASIAAADDGRFMEANDNYERDFGWPRNELIGRTSVEVGIWPDQATRAPWAEAIRREGRLVNYETVWMHKNGERRNVSLSAEITELNGKTCILAYATDITARKRAEQALVSSETRLRAVLDGVQSGVVTITENGIVESFNQSAERMFGYGAVEVIGRNVAMLMPVPYSAAHDGYLENYRHSGIRKVIGFSRDVVARRKDGSTFPIELGVTETFLNGTRFFIGSVSDISFRRKAEAELRIAATAFESQEGMVVTDPDGVILRVNKAFTDISGYTAEEVVGQTPRLLKSGRHDAAFYAAMWASLASTGAWQGEVWDRRKNGEVYPKWLTISAVKGDDGVVSHYVGTHQDITERKNAEERIKELAFFDSLTRLPNRTLLMDRLKQAMTAGNRNGTFGAVLFIDLDHFKTLNDTLGHDKGDLLLQQVAQRLAASVREGDTVARLGGDEFVVVLGSLNKTAEEAANETEAVGEKILAVLNQTYLLGDIDYRSTASIGATLFRGHETSIEDLLKQADLAMYKSKETGRNGLHFFDPAMQTVVVERVALEMGLRTAIEGNQLLLHYQAQVDAAGRVTGAEALVRWRHPERGMVSPAEFIPLAEETGLILPLGQWVLETACAQLALWAIRPEMAHLTVAVNVSAQEFRDPDFVLKVVAILNQTRANPNRLKLELTESLLVDNVKDVIETMVALKARGVGFSLDDFGTGYSSLSYLKRLPLDQLKIDQSFVRDILIDPNDAAIARTIVALAQSLGLGVIAEGVETETQRAFLASAGCQAYQGYFFSRPLPVEGFEEFAQRA
jgi:diguanylate cyclase (GGDEF)-like protein/PAS domain S-box-containing protein